jgi:hypothetical protein
MATLKSNLLKIITKKLKAGKPLTNKEKIMIASIPGVKYSGSGTDPAVNALLKTLYEKGPGSLDSSGFKRKYGSRFNKLP